MEIEKCVTIHDGKVLEGYINRETKNITFEMESPSVGTIGFKYENENELNNSDFFFGTKEEYLSKVL
jgi:hypothetical protein